MSIAVLALALLSNAISADEQTISLAGKWRFELDPDQSGVDGRWYERKLSDEVTLPGTTDTNRKGKENRERHPDRLSRIWSWIGPAWYQREVTIPESWTGKRITLFFERTKNSKIWVGDQYVGTHDSLSAPHIFDVTKWMGPGKHIVTMLIDNAKIPPVGPAHAVDERTQTNWNGIVGRMELQATPPVWIDDVQVFPSASIRQAKVRAVIGNITSKPIEGKIIINSESYNTKSPQALSSAETSFNAVERRNVIEFNYEPGAKTPLWDEFDPALIRLSLNLQASSDDAAHQHTFTTRFGMRDFVRKANRLLLNGRPVFLRGRIDCANFPLTGYAPMDKPTWTRFMKIHKEWGLNHIRYHSWCPPAAAFEAADENGILLQPELPNKRSAFNAPDNADAAKYNIDFMEVETNDSTTSLYEYAKREGALIFRHFGNSPSFVLFTLGNELGRNQGMFEMVAHYQKQDPRRLYAQGSNNMHWKPSLAEGDDFWVIGKLNNIDKPLRGSFSLHDFPNPHIEMKPPSTMTDYSYSIEGVPVPLIGHETGQFQVSPNFKELEKFTGVLSPRNYEIFRERMAAAGVLEQANEFSEASGALAVTCYREDVEAGLRTSGLGGIQLLDLQDFPGQGTALVGLLDVFMDSKGLITPDRWREFCSETVPLFRMGKYTWTTGEVFGGKIEIAHFGPADIENALITADLTAADGSSLAKREYRLKRLPTGDVTDIGDFQFNLADLEKIEGQQLTLILAIEGTPFRNRYPLWVYPVQIDNSVPDGVKISRSLLDADTKSHLANGGRVLLFPDLEKLPLSVEGQFQTEFWSPMFAQSARNRKIKEPPGTLGFVCDPSHPALSRFATASHCDWQWWHLVKNGRPIIFDGSPDGFRPIIQVIDNFDRNHRLGLVAETKVGPGKLLVCSINLPAVQDRPEGRQLMHSLLAYAGSPEFSPEFEIPDEKLRALFPK